MRVEEEAVAVASYPQDLRQVAVVVEGPNIMMGFKLILEEQEQLVRSMFDGNLVTRFDNHLVAFPRFF